MDADIKIVDDDMVELNQIKYQNFTKEEAGKSKAEVLGNRYNFEYAIERVGEGNTFGGFDLVVLCVDNDKTREFVVRHCHKNNIDFIDLRATGRRIFAMVKEKTLEKNLRFIDDDNKEYSCQDKSDLDKGWVQMGNEIIATIGCQMILNISRGHNNKTLSESI